MKDQVDDFLDKVVLPPQIGALNTAAAPIRVVMGIICIATSIGKFTRHASLVESFESYGVPNPESAVTMAGVIELVGGLMLVAGLMTRITAVVLSLHFAVAVGTGGRVEQDLSHLGLGVMMLFGCFFLIWAGAGPWSADQLIYDKRREWA